MEGSILQPPRAFQLGILFVFPEDARTDAELQAYILRSVSPNLEVGGFAKGAAVVRVTVPTDNGGLQPHA